MTDGSPYGPPPAPGGPAMPPGGAPAWPPGAVPGRTRPPRPRPKVRASILFPFAGLFVVALCVFVLPWAEAGGESITLPDVWDAGADVHEYLEGGWAALLVPSLILAFAGTLDSLTFRILFAAGAGLAGGALLTSAVFAVMVAAAAPGTDGTDGAGTAGIVAGPAIGGLIVIALGIGYVFCRGLAGRIISGLLLLVAAVIHVVAVEDVFDGANAEPGAYAASVGYLLCAVGAFIGPRYVQPSAPAPPGFPGQFPAGPFPGHQPPPGLFAGPPPADPAGFGGLPGAPLADPALAGPPLPPPPLPHSPLADPRLPGTSIPGAGDGGWYPGSSGPEESSYPPGAPYPPR